MPHMRKFQHKLARSTMLFLAYCGIAKALRQQHSFRRGLPAVICVVLPEDADIEVYESAAYYVLCGGTPRLAGDDQAVVIHRKGPWSKPMYDHLMATVRDKSQLLILTETVDSLPSGFAAVADAVVQVSQPSPKHILAACKLCLNQEVTENQAEFVASFPLTIIGTALRRGRPIATSIERMKLAVVPKMEAKDTATPTLGDLHGLGEAGEWGRELAIDLADWQAGKIQWSDVDRGILLSGPPGTGKTTFAAALARTCGVYLALGSIARWQAKGHLGDMLKAMRKTFDDAKANAPSIVFLDEIDAIGDRERFSGHGRQYATEVVSALLECLDGSEGREGVVVVGACNHPTLIDMALTRPRRFDRQRRGRDKSIYILQTNWFPIGQTPLLFTVALPELYLRSWVGPGDLAFRDLTKNPSTGTT